MNYASTFRFNVVVAIAIVAFLSMFSLSFAQQTNYYNSMTPNPTGNPSITNTIIPGATNIPTGNSNTTVVAAVPTAGGVSSGTSVPAVPNTGGVQSPSATPGVPNTGAGGDANGTFMTLILSAVVAAIGLLALNRKKSRE